MEGAAFLLLAPLGLLLGSEERIRIRLTHIGKVYLVLAVACLGMLPILELTSTSGIGLGRIDEIVNQIFHALEISTNVLSEAKTSLKEHVLTAYAQGEASNILAGGILAVVLMQWFNSFGLLYIGLAAFGLYRVDMSSRDGQAEVIWWGFVVINFMVGILFVSQQLFLSERYVGFLGLILIPMSARGLLGVHQIGERERAQSAMTLKDGR